jgi:NADPH:quinone reductase-like Zn-dependent oxidoreductase
MDRTATTFIVARANLHAGKFVTAPLTMQPGGAILRVDRFALTANNITYAAFGEAMKYWNFFPAPEAGFGVIPVWGFGTVVASEAEGLGVGDRFYGYYPFGSYLAVEPVRIGANGFTDGAAHRAPMAAVYNQYVRTSNDPLYDAATEAEQLLLRPLFSTAFLIDDFLADASFFGAEAVLLSSASSKTAYASAYLLKKRSGAQIIGLTSKANAAFVESLGCYDRVVTYDELTALAASLAVAYVDMAGNTQLRAAIHHHFGDSLKYDCAVGATNWDADRTGAGEALPGARTQMFFAPSQAAKRTADWGGQAFGEKLGAAWHDFIAAVRNPRAPWIHVVHGQGASEAARLYSDVLAGKTPPREGIVLSLSQS